MADGQVQVGGAFADGALSDRESVTADLRRCYRQESLQLAFDAPEFSSDAAVWAACRLYRCCQAVAKRELEAEALRAELLTPYPGKIGPGEIFSADLCLRQLPELRRLARGLAFNDPLLGCLDTLGKAWPLSSVGMELGDFVADLKPFWECRALRQLYVDRIMKAKDLGRTKPAEVGEAVIAAMGIHRDWWPELEMQGPLHQLQVTSGMPEDKGDVVAHLSTDTVKGA
jgi:hypothetical protein